VREAAKDEASELFAVLDDLAPSAGGSNGIA
jgi:hypothetical protein